MTGRNHHLLMDIMCVLSHSVVSLSPHMDCSPQVLLSMGFSRQEYMSGLSFPPPEDLLDPWIEPTSPVSPALAGRFFTAEPPGKPLNRYYLNRKIKKKKKELTHTQTHTKMEACRNEVSCPGSKTWQDQMGHVPRWAVSRICALDQYRILYVCKLGSP